MDRVHALFSSRLFVTLRKYFNDQSEDTYKQKNIEHIEYFSTVINFFYEFGIASPLEKYPVESFDRICFLYSFFKCFALNVRSHYIHLLILSFLFSFHLGLFNFKLIDSCKSLQVN